MIVVIENSMEDLYNKVEAHCLENKKDKEKEMKIIF